MSGCANKFLFCSTPGTMYLLSVVTFILLVCCAVRGALVCLQSPWLSLCWDGLCVFLVSNRGLASSPSHNVSRIRFEFCCLSGSP